VRSTILAGLVTAAQHQHLQTLMT